MGTGITYKNSGVDISRGNKFVERIKPIARSTFTSSVLNDLGSFGAFFHLDKSGYRSPVLVSSTDGVGTKLKIAFMTKRHDTVGIDLVAMCVNDILTSGARPLFFLDYFASGKLTTGVAVDIIRGIADGCRMAGCSLIGGETAEMPGFYKKGEYDLSGFAVGVVDKKDIINGSGIKNGDILLGLSSSGLHSNGYSLVRKLFFEVKKYRPGRRMKGLDRTIGEELLKPTRIYVKSVLKIITEYKIKGIAHITGGGLTENLPRIIPKKKSLGFVIKKKSWPVHGIFDLIQKSGSISESEMYRTFNMGLGLVLVAEPSDSQGILKRLKRFGENAFVIGRIKRGKGGVEYV
jgi:phosphoribosylformylglycinamidine cyclo-ligase